MRISTCMMRLNFDKEKIIEEMRRAIEIFPDRAETHFSLGCYFNNLGYHDLAYPELISAKEKNFNEVQKKYILFLDPFSYGKYINHQLIICCHNLGKYGECLKYISEIIDDDTLTHIRPEIKRYFDLCVEKILIS